MIKAAVIGIIAVFLAAPLKKDKQQFATAITICAGIIIIGLAMNRKQFIRFLNRDEENA